MFPFDIEAIDTDGAVRDAAEAVPGNTRRNLLRGALVAGGTAAGAGALLAKPWTASAKPSPKQDYAILNFALTLEYLESSFYAWAIDTGALSGLALEFARLVAEHEETHVSVLRAALENANQATVAEPAFNFGTTVTDQATFLKTSFALENTGVQAYLGQAGNLSNSLYLSVAAKIVTTEARHAAAAAVLINRGAFTDKSASSITPNGAFDVPASKSAVLQIVRSTGFITG